MVNNAWIYTPLPQYVFVEWYLVKQRKNFIIPLLSSSNIIIQGRLTQGKDKGVTALN